MRPRMLVAGTLVLAACGGESAVVDRGETDGAPVVAIAAPVPPERVKEPPRGSRELAVARVGPVENVGPAMYGIYLIQPRDRRRDACLMMATPGDEAVIENDTYCDVLRRGTISAFIDRPAQGPPWITIGGVAGPGVRSLTIDGPGGRYVLPLSAHRAFAAVYYAPSARGTVRLTWVARGRTRVRTFRLPPSARQLRAPQHRGRRPGAVFADEVGKPILDLSRRQVHRRFGRPAAVRGRCEYYEVVGYPRDGWEFCFTRRGRMTSAAGNKPPRR